MTGPVTTEALVEARALIRHSLKVGAPGLSETAREAVLRSIMLKLEGKVLAPFLAEYERGLDHRNDLMDRVISLKTSVAAAEARAAQLQAEVEALTAGFEQVMAMSARDFVSFRRNRTALAARAATAREE